MKLAFPACVILVAINLSGHCALGAVDLYEAVNSGDAAEIERLLSTGANINERNAQTETPLDIALRFHNVAIVRLLVAKGANISTKEVFPNLEFREEEVPPGSGIKVKVRYLPAPKMSNVEYADDPEFGPLFQRYLLRKQLLNLSANDALTHPENSIGKFQNNYDAPFALFKWTVAGNPCQGSRTYVGNDAGSVWPITSTQKQDFRNVEYGIEKRTTELYVVPVPGIYNSQCVVRYGGMLQHYGIHFTVEGETVIPRCEMDFASNPTCWPEVFVDSYNATVNVIHGGGTTLLVKNDTRVFDRSLSEVRIKFIPATADSFSYGLRVSLPDFARNACSAVDGICTEVFPKLEVYDDLSLSVRLATYGMLIYWNAELAAASGDPNPAGAIRAKTAATSIHVLSAMAAQKQYPQHLLQVVRSRARDIALADSRVKDLADVIFASDIMTPEEIDFGIARIEALTKEVDAQQGLVLAIAIRELQRAREAAAAVGSSVRILHDHYFNDLDRMIEEYQGTILELAQFYPSDALSYEMRLSSDDLAAINRKIKPRDVFITDTVLSNRGSSIRSLFGLPAPTSE